MASTSSTQEQQCGSEARHHHHPTCRDDPSWLAVLSCVVCLVVGLLGAASAQSTSSVVTFVFPTTSPVPYNVTSFAQAVASGLNTTVSRITNVYIFSDNSTVTFQLLGTTDSPDSADVLSTLRIIVNDGQLLQTFPSLVSVMIGNETLFFPATPTVSGNQGLPPYLVAIIAIVAVLIAVAIGFIVYKVLRDNSTPPKEFELPPLPTFQTAGATHVAHIVPDATQAEVRDNFNDWWTGKTEAKPRVYV